MQVFKNTRLQGVFERGFSSEGNFVISLAWVLSGLVAFLAPLIHRTIHKNKYEEMYMSYYWEKEYEYEAEQRAEGYEKYGNNYNYGGAYMYPYEYMEREYWDVNNCRWWQFNCFPYYVNQDGEPMPEQGWYPNCEEDREMMESGHKQPGSLKFAYCWQLLIFVCILWYGVRVIRQHRRPTGLLIALFIWTNYAFMSMWLMADGSIQTDGQGVTKTGFYGQMSVLIFMSNFWYFLHGLLFLIIFGVRAWMLHEDDYHKEQKNKSVSAKIAEAEQGNYSAPAASSKKQQAPTL
ncbi:MAG: hypothetical protein SGARI_003519 [Bacillariaceae sp.]